MSEWPRGAILNQGSCWRCSTAVLWKEGVGHARPVGQSNLSPWLQGSHLPVDTGTGGTRSTRTLPEHFIQKGTFLPLHCGSRRPFGSVWLEGKAALSEVDRKRINRLFPSMTWIPCKALHCLLRSRHCLRLRFTGIWLCFLPFGLDCVGGEIRWS